MLNPPNSLSLLRAPLALFFIVENATVRIGIVILAMLTDCVDGFLARRYRYTSRIGAILDPVMDKVFVYIVLTILLYENCILLWQAIMFVSRDLFLFLFTFYLLITGIWKHTEFRALFWGKISTASQFLLLAMLPSNIPVPPFIYYLFILFGFLAFIEMIQLSRNCPSV